MKQIKRNNVFIIDQLVQFVRYGWIYSWDPELEMARSKSQRAGAEAAAQERRSDLGQEKI